MLSVSQHYDGTVTLGLSVVTKSHKPIETVTQERERRGLNGISSYGQRQLRSAVELMQDEIGVDCLGFGTATVPSVSEAENLAISENWSEIVRRFMQEYRRKLLKHGLSDKIALCTEVQLGRFAATGQVVMHIHWAYQCRESADHREYPIKPGWVQATWQRILQSFIGRPIKTRSSTRIERVRKSAVGYMAKYLSKGCEQLKEIKARGLGKYLPRSWYSMTDSLRKRVDATTYKMKVDDSALPVILAFPGLKVKPVEVDMGSQKPVLVGYVGYIKSKKDREKFTDLLVLLHPDREAEKFQARLNLQGKLNGKGVKRKRIEQNGMEQNGTSQEKENEVELEVRADEIPIRLARMKLRAQAWEREEIIKNHVGSFFGFKDEEELVPHPA